MKRLSFGSFVVAPGQGEDAFRKWATEAFETIARASAEDIEAKIAEITLSGTLTPRRTFNAGTATLAELRDVVATLISDVQNGGSKSGT